MHFYTKKKQQLTRQLTLSCVSVQCASCVRAVVIYLHDNSTRTWRALYTYKRQVSTVVLYRQITSMHRLYVTKSYMPFLTLRLKRKTNEQSSYQVIRDWNNVIIYQYWNPSQLSEGWKCKHVPNSEYVWVNKLKRDWLELSGPKHRKTRLTSRVCRSIRKHDLKMGYIRVNLVKRD